MAGVRPREIRLANGGVLKLTSNCLIVQHNSLCRTQSSSLAYDKITLIDTHTQSNLPFITASACLFLLGLLSVNPLNVMLFLTGAICLAMFFLRGGYHGGNAILVIDTLMDKKWELPFASGSKEELNEVTEELREASSGVTHRYRPRGKSVPATARN